MKQLNKFLLILVILFIMVLINKAHSEPLHVVVIDTGYSGVTNKLCKSGHYDFTTKTPTIGSDSLYKQHGTYVVDTIVDTAKNHDYCIQIYKISFGKKNSELEYLLALSKAIKSNAEIVNISSTSSKYDSFEKLLLESSTKTTFIAATGNDGKNLDKKCDTYPACYNLAKVYPVTSDSLQANKGSIAKLTADFCHKQFCGTSASTAIATGSVILEWLGVEKMKTVLKDYLNNIIDEK